MKRLLIIGIVISITFSCTQNSQSEKKNDKAAAQKGSKLVEESDLELAVHMGFMQRYLEKAFFAAQAQNAPLHDFYVHELEEEMELIQEAGVIDDGVNVSYNMLHYGLKSLETYEQRIEEEGLSAYKGHFQNLINGCNSCHMVSKKPFVQIQMPATNPYSSQKFTP